MEEQELTIAVIDDDPGDTELLRQYLEDIREWDVDLLTYEDSGSARSGLAGRAVDAIFVDYLLGAETGLEVLEQLLSLNITAPIIMLTGHGSEEVAVQALKAEGKNDHVFTVGMGMYAGGPESIKAGDLNASWELFPAELGRLAGKSAVKILAGEDVEPLISTDMVFVTKDNIAEFLKD